MEELGVDPRARRQGALWRNIRGCRVERRRPICGRSSSPGHAGEDARGLLPTNILTRVHMRVDMKTLLNLAGMRLCTQAQMEWRGVFAALARAWGVWATPPAGAPELIADAFRLVRYAANRCLMKASDRYCSIRACVDEFEREGVPSSEWEVATPGVVRPIHPACGWRIATARVAPGGAREHHVHLVILVFLVVCASCALQFATYQALRSLIAGREEPQPAEPDEKYCRPSRIWTAYRGAEDRGRPPASAVPGVYGRRETAAG
ncbi:MAG: FAD-dependent thymidylate synthase [Gemmatimonadetes bacterium]|nr:FAD-dependent thymidylate synthase [Gemmatimonadota bacterium]